MTKTRQAMAFYAITLVLAVLVRLAVPVIGRSSLPVTMLTPAIAVAIMAVLVAPESGFRYATMRLGLTNAGFKGWSLAIFAPALITGFGLAILVGAGLTNVVMPKTGFSPTTIIADVFLGFVIGTAFALGEEVGWRGYMLPRLKGLGAVNSMLIVGFLHGVWHLPILLTTDYYHNSGNAWIVVPFFLVTLTLAGVFYGFLRIWTGSVWPVALAHAAANAAWSISSEVAETKSPAVLEYYGGESGLIMILSLLVLNYLIIRYMAHPGFNATCDSQESPASA